MGSQRVRYDLATKVKNFCRAVGEVGDAMEESASFGEAGTRSRPLHCLPPPGDSSKEERPFLLPEVQGTLRIRFIKQIRTDVPIPVLRTPAFSGSSSISLKDPQGSF